MTIHFGSVAGRMWRLDTPAEARLNGSFGELSEMSDPQGLAQEGWAPEWLNAI